MEIGQTELPIYESLKNISELDHFISGKHRYISESSILSAGITDISANLTFYPRIGTI
ncbi:hypothetical protein [Neobacillus drentensis]|uniref:hypothetical protein n=1 Tax=Neobacillus drentensis TaxID=220684 RepID=UPI003002FD6C